MAKLLVDNTMYEGPLVTWKGTQQYLEGANQVIQGGFNSVKPLKQFENGDTVCTITEIEINTPNCPILVHGADLTKIVGNKIAESRTFYDPRKIIEFCSPKR
ncbi:MAG: hypothetical protein EPO63_01945 [Candidatus Nitrosotenuis sp.]|nr:MAG: hypothetical protein EPO63_01945 [Candidatus Nitrosotenuis sp.]